MNIETAKTLKIGDKVKYVHDLVPEGWEGNHLKDNLGFKVGEEFTLTSTVDGDDIQASFTTEESTKKLLEIYGLKAAVMIKINGAPPISIKHFEKVE